MYIGIQNNYLLKLNFSSDNCLDFAAVNVTASFAAMRKYQSRGPLVNSEFYPGWLTHWEERMQRVNTSAVLATMKELLDLKANFNIYMFFGGTNFGFMNGTLLLNSNKFCRMNDTVIVAVH